jgi:hypothetical protein
MRSDAGWVLPPAILDKLRRELCGIHRLPPHLEVKLRWLRANRLPVVKQTSR